ncbi:MAG TPA: hypothetical protein VEH47_07890 [Candidatus Acidoferrales bacterium]|nr:hypothetical protein [Candidatus Acidoferrales bacterium]
MSTAAVSSPSIFQELQSFYQSRQADVKQLGSALQNGDLNGAQQAYNALAALGQSGPFASSEPFSKSSRAQAFEAVGQALQSGDLAGAQAAFATLTGKSSPEGAAQPASSAVATLSPAQPLSGQPISATTAPSASSIYQQLQSYWQERKADLAQLGTDLQAGNLNAAQQDFNTLTALGQSGPNKNGQTFERADRAQDFQAIGQALESGNLAGAQSAFATLEGTFGQQSPQAQSAISAYNSNSGEAEIVINLGGTPSTSASSGSSGSTAPEVVVNLGQGGGSLSGASSGPEVVINLGGASSASSTGASGGSTTPEIVVNLGQENGSSASPEEVTINLGSGSSGAPASIDATQDATQGQNSSPAGQLTITLNQQNNYEVILNLLNSSATSPTQSSSNALSVSA